MQLNAQLRQAAIQFHVPVAFPPHSQRLVRQVPQPVILLINNGGYTIERGYLGKDETYNDVANWAYADLPKVFRRDTSARSFVVTTVGDLQNALGTPNDTMIFVESIMDPYDALAPITHNSNKGAELDYGPRGPQHRHNQQLRPGTYGHGERNTETSAAAKPAML
jgi:indolepyruvate decarboxylase